MANNNEPLLSENQVWSVLEFAQALNNTIPIGGLFTPDLLNRNLVNLNNNPKTPTYEQVVSALTEAVNQAENLQAYTEWAEFMDMVFKRTMMYYENMLSFDLTITCTNATKEDYQTKSYKRDRAVIDDFLDRFDYQAEFRKVVKQLLRTEIDYTWLRNNENEDNPQYTLQIMPQKYCTLTGYWEKGLLYDFDINFFLQPSTDIRQFDPVFRKIFNSMFKGDGYNNYIPTNQFDKRDGTFAYWTQLSPYYDDGKLPHGAWAFKFDTGNFSSVPFLSSLMKDTVLNLPVQKLQYDKDMASAYGMLMGEIEMLDSTEPNATAFTPKNLGALMNIVKRAIGKYVGVGAMPAKNIHYYQYKDDNAEMYENQIKTSTATGASASRVIYSSDKMSQEEIRNAIITDYNIMKKLYPQFNNFMNFYANKLTKKYKFSFSFNGSNYSFEREQRQEQLMKLAEIGVVLNDTAFASAYGFKPNEFRRMLEETSSEGSWINDLTTLTSIHTSSGKEGRPKQSSVSSQSREYDYTDE